MLFFFFLFNSAVATLPQGACTQRSNGEMKRWTGRQMEGCEMEEYKAGRLVELEVFQRERNGREALKLSKGGQRGEDSGETKKGIIWYRSEGEREEGEK